MSHANPPAIVRANNPCALRPLARGRWSRQTGTIRTPNGLFCSFAAPVWGVRAGLRNLDTYRRVHGLRSVRQMIGRWAPAHDRNPEAAYVRFVARRVGIAPDTPVPETHDSLRRLVAAIIRFECGYDAVGPEIIAQAMALMADEETRAGRDPSPYLADSAPLKPLSRSKEIALGGGAATIGVGGAVAYGGEVVEMGRQAIDVATPAVEQLPVNSTADLACIGSFVLLILFGGAVVANRLRARFRAER